MIELRDYQKNVYDDTLAVIRTNQLQGKVSRLALFLPTGAGKSVVIGKFAEDLNGRTLILTNRIDILKQNKEWLGDDCGLLTADIEDVMSYHKVVISMVETLHSRVKSFGEDYLGDFDNIILDEAHINVFHKVYNKYKFKVLIGLTATPLFNKKIRKEINGVKYQRQLVFGDFYDQIIQGTSTQDLIDGGWLVQEYNVVLQKGVTDNLVSSNSAPDGYTVKSLEEQYTNTASIKILKDSYLKYGVGKKTIIFNPSTKVSDYVYKALKDIAPNVRSFDSRSGKKQRQEIIDWFDETPDAVLINVNVFTTGFDNKEIECIILNRATKSLSLYHQMVGRGSRPSRKIFKDYFTVVDLGDNIYNHGVWSKDIDWSEYFYPTDFYPSKTLSIISTWDCLKCGNINPLAEFRCECGNTVEENNEVTTKKKELKTRSGKLITINEIPIPLGNKIVEYTMKRGEGSSFAFNLANKKIVNLFKHNYISEDFYNSKKDVFKKRIEEIFNPIYFAIIGSELQGANRTLQFAKDRLFKKIEEIWCK